MEGIKFIENIERAITGLIGAFILLVAFNIYNPFKEEKQKVVLEKYRLFFIIAGALMIIDAVVKLFF